MIWYDIWYDMTYYMIYDMIYDMLRYDIYMIWYMIWYDMIWYDMIRYMIWYDMIWYDMIWYDMIWYDMIYVLTAIGLSPVVVVQYTFTHKQYNTIQKKYTEQHNNFGRGSSSRMASFFLPSGFQLIIIFGNRFRAILSTCPYQISCFRVIQYCIWHVHFFSNILLNNLFSNNVSWYN